MSHDARTTGSAGCDQIARSWELTDHRTNNFEKWLLAFYKKYPKGEVPDHVPQNVMERTRNVFRVQANILLTVVTLVVAVGFALQGRREAHRGYGLTRMNRDWHEEQRRGDAPEGSSASR